MALEVVSSNLITHPNIFSLVCYCHSGMVVVSPHNNIVTVCFCSGCACLLAILAVCHTINVQGQDGYKVTSKQATNDPISVLD